ncbi:MAG: GH3 auxin-responsive promoter family protein, partial [Methylococcales bacterium]
ISQYQVFIELAGKQTVTTDQLADTLQTALTSQNIEYQQKTSDGRLKPLELKLLKTGTGEIYKQYKLNQGQREGQFKVLTLIYVKDSDFSFDLHLNSASDRA